jgi:hypothetical protein
MGRSDADREGFAGGVTLMAADDDGRALARGVRDGDGDGDGGRLVRLGAGADAAGRRALGRSSPDLPASDVWRP